MIHDAIHVAHQLLRLADVVDEGDVRQAFIGARPFTSRWHLTSLLRIRG